MSENNEKETSTLKETYTLDEILETNAVGFEATLEEISNCIFKKDFESIMNLPENFIIEGLSYNEMHNKLLGYYMFQLTIFTETYSGTKDLLAFLKELRNMIEKYAKLFTDRLLEVGLILPSYVH
jgi:hypothetical protein|nr:MAG TPA: hypothetical protein [Caudoviricetes sp.]DAP37699.1 MAG TPA: hypothetical protein [Herelleviridae sp.]DAQ59507.1 MAG TPA: hypothetical protein [Caudoviricetes sp.]DAR68444.1 MAG TPA: hypothetical protein [Caudoviricetes sp.]DAT60816.1 MAG TPA: hypothetical protein [Bacteriophage sp.]